MGEIGPNGEIYLEAELIEAPDGKTWAPCYRKAAEKLLVENVKLREFAKYVLDDLSWGNGEGDSDGGSIQDKAEQLGLIELRKLSPERAEEEGVGELFFCVWTPKEVGNG